MQIGSGETGFWDVNRDGLGRVPLVALIRVSGIVQQGPVPVVTLFVLDNDTGQTRLAETLPNIAGNFRETAEGQ